MIVESSFQVAWWLKNPHLQTLWSSAFRQIKPVKTRLQRLELDDGDFVDLEWVVNDNIPATSPVLLLLHGLEGSLDSVYIQNLLHSVKNNNWHLVVLNFRSCSKELNRLPRSYHSGETEDLSHVLQVLKMTLPEAPIMCTGFSLGGNVLLKYLGEKGADSEIDFAAAVSVPFLLNKASARMDKGFSRFYRNNLLRELKAKTRKKLQEHAMALAGLRSDLEKIVTFYDFDDQITAPLHGFKSATDYYHRCSCRHFLNSIKCPTLILHAVDDPFMTKDVIPIAKELSESVILELSAGGGHVGFIAGTVPWQSYSYIDRRIPGWLQEQLIYNRKVSPIPEDE